MMPYERLDAWRICHELVLAVYRATARFPTEERYGLTSQMRRAAASAATNIAEGAAKRGKAEFRRYLDIAIGSLSEVSYLLRLAGDLGILTPPDADEVSELRERAGIVTWKLYTSLGRRR